MAILCLTSFVTMHDVHAANRFWITSGGGAFGVPGTASPNWSTTDGGAAFATAPSTADVANFTLNSSYTVTFSQNVTNDTLDVQNGSVTFSLGGNTYTVTATGQSARIGRLAGQTGRLSLTSGTVQADDTMIGGNFSSAVGILTVSGASSVWNDTQMIVGDLGNGTLMIQNGGDVNQSLDATVGDDVGSVGTATIVNSGSQWNIARFFNVGASGTGSVDVTAGGAVTALTVRVGAAPGGVGNLLVRGTGSTFTGTGTAGVSVGGTDSSAGGTGVLSIETGGTVSITNASGELRLWPTGTANLNGGTLSLPDFEFRGGAFNFNTGTLMYTGSKTFTASDISQVLGSEATLTPGRTLSIASTATIQSALIIDGGALTVATLANQSTLALKSGNLNVTGAGGLNLNTAGLPTLAVPQGANVNVSNGLTVGGGNHLILQGGAIAAGSITNNGEIQLAGATSQITASSLLNNKLLLGDGRVNANLNNQSAGEVRASGTQRLVFNGSSHSNSGKINLLSGGTAEFASGQLFNNNGATISGRGTLIAAAGIFNTGTVQLSGGFSDVFGTLTNNSAGKVIVTGGSTSTFYNNVTSANGSEFRVSTGSTAVFFDDVAGTNNFTGSGTKIFEGGSAALDQLATVTGDTIVESSATLSANRIDEDSLTVNGLVTIASGGSPASSVGALTVAATGRVDVNDGGLVIRNGGSGATGQTTTQQLTGYLKTGLENGGAFDWQGPGISSTEAFNDNTTAGSVLYGVGILQNNLAAAGIGDGTTTDATPGNEIYTTFEGRTVALNDTLVRYTYMGDADLDGSITGTDYSLIDSGFAFQLSGWLNGDFDYSGAIDSTDYALIDNAFAFQTGPLSPAFLALYDQHVAAFGQSYVDAFAAVQSGVVPEPGTIGVLALAGIGLLARRRVRA